MRRAVMHKSTMPAVMGGIPPFPPLITTDSTDKSYLNKKVSGKGFLYAGGPGHGADNILSASTSIAGTLQYNI